MATGPLERIAHFDKVVVVTGHLTDEHGRPDARFPGPREPFVAAQCEAVFAEWGIGAGDLVITGGARGADIIGAEVALHRGATTWLLLAYPDERFLDASVRLAGTQWEERFWRLRQRCPSWYNHDRPDRGSNDRNGDAEVFAQTNAWILEVARNQAGGRTFCVVAVWDREPAGGAGGTADIVAEAERQGAIVHVIAPM